MSKCKPPTFAELAAGAANGRHVVCSIGAMDGPMLRALAAVGLVVTADGTVTSTWAEGVSSDNGQVSAPITGSNVQSDMPKGGVSDGKNAVTG